MGVQIVRRRRPRVPHSLAHGLQRNLVQHELASVHVAQVVDPDAGYAGVLDDADEDTPQIVREDWPTHVVRKDVSLVFPDWNRADPVGFLRCPLTLEHVDDFGGKERQEYDRRRKELYAYLDSHDIDPELRELIAAMED